MALDYVILLFLLSFFVSGWTKGAFRSAIGPVAFLVFGLIAIINFDLNRNLIKALMIMSIGTTVTMAAIWILWALSRRSIPPDQRDYLFWGSRVIGAVTSLMWRGVLLGLFLVFVTILPDSMVGPKIKQSIRESKTYMYIHLYLADCLPYVEKASEFTEIATSPSWAESIRDSGRYKAFMQNEKVQRIVNDAELMKQLENKDVVQLLSSSKINDLLADENLMKEFTEIVKLAMEKQHEPPPPSAPVSTPEAEEQPAPAVYNP